MREKDYVVIIGSANIDVAGYSHESLNYADSNPGKIKFTPGGVGRNIAQNLALLEDAITDVFEEIDHETQFAVE